MLKRYIEILVLWASNIFSYASLHLLSGERYT